MNTSSALNISDVKNRKRRFAFLLLAALLTVPVFTAVQRTVNTQEHHDLPDRPLETNAGWTATGNMATARANHTATLLPNGKILVAGGQVPGGFGTIGTATAEIYDPTTGVWASTGSLIAARYGHSSSLLPNGKVIVIGGYDQVNSLNTVEIYDPAIGTWASAGTINIARSGHTTSALPDGGLLVAGGSNFFGLVIRSEIYNPTIASSNLSGSFVISARRGHTATTLPNGKVMVTGGDGIGGPFNTAEIHDLATGNWNLTGSMAIARSLHAASILPDGKVLVSGNVFASPSSSELYDPISGTWSATGNLIEGRAEHTSTLLRNNLVLVAGGLNRVTNQNIPLTETYNPASGTWSSAGSLATPRRSHTATLLQSGKVLVVGGSNASTFLRSSELYDPATPTPTPTLTPSPSPPPTPSPTPPGTCLVNPIVDNSADSGPSSLRAAVTSACTGSTITFSNSVVNPIRLESDSIVITKSLNIQGPSSRRVTISGNDILRVLNVSGPVNVTISRLNLTEGRRFSGSGSAIVNFNGSTLTLDECTVAGNSGGSDLGGAISNFEATLNIFNSTVSNNRGGSRGAGIASIGTLNVTNSTISGNSIQDFGNGGGGIYVGSGVASIVNSTITENGTQGPSAIASRGGGIFNDRGTVNVRNSIIAGNGDLGPPSPAPDVFGSFVSRGYNLIGQNDGSTGFPVGSPNAGFDIVGMGSSRINPLLGPLASNGGSTQTHALLAGSPAIDKAALATTSGTSVFDSFDQRGLARPVNNPSVPPAGGGNDADIGAFELQFPTITGIEGDVVDGNGLPAGDGLVAANDVTAIRNFVLGLSTPVTTPNQFQRADINGICGDGNISAADVTFVRLIILGSLPLTPACGPASPIFNSNVDAEEK